MTEAIDRYYATQTALEERVRGLIEARDEKEEEPKPTILVSGRLAEDSEIVRPARALRKLLEQYGWEVKIGYSKAATPDVYLKSGENKGTIRFHSKEIELCWVEAVRSPDWIRVTWYTTNGKTTIDSRVTNRHNGLVTDKILKELIERE